MNIKIYDTVLVVKVTKKQKKTLQARAKKLGVSASEIIRTMIELK